MSARTTGGRRRDRGSALALTLAFAAIVGALIIGAVAVANLQSRSVRYEVDRTEALALAEGATDWAKKQMLEEVANFLPPSPSGTATIGGRAIPWTATAVGGPIVRTDPDGVQLAIQPYRVEASVQVDSGFATVVRILDLTLTPLFQFMIFYDDDLEILPGPSMTLEGRVHTNASLYVGAGNTLTVDTDYFRATEEILRQRKNDGSPTGGTVDIRRQGTSDFEAMTPAMDSSHADWVQLALDTWDGTVQSGAHGVTALAVPEIGSIQPGGYYDQNAGLRIVDGQAFDGAGNAILLPPGTISQVTMYDAREGRDVTLTEIDVGLLNASGRFPANGLIHAHRTDATSDQPNGIRLANAAELAGPLTVVSPDPVYVRGDYNTVGKKGAAVISDAVSLLSNAWDDSKGPGDLPGAADTDYNFAMITGNVRTPDGGGSYSGGFENLPRFHENWTGVTARIRGAFANLYESAFADAPWRYGGDVYTAPIRDWRYDPDLLDPDHLPPFTPNAVYVRQALWDDGIPIPFQVLGTP